MTGMKGVGVEGKERNSRRCCLGRTAEDSCEICANTAPRIYNSVFFCVRALSFPASRYIYAQ